MGGSRCSYRNCTVRSDGSTHMFHYPVFDRVRCHNWLVKAQRLDFLNLKVSQLINRRVCQNHFADNMFMNYMKDKLTHTAVPTLDGPYVKSVDTPQNAIEFASDIDYLCSIKTDDIENEISDKKAIFSEKYGNFLANCDLLELNENLCDKTSLMAHHQDQKKQDSYPINIEVNTDTNVGNKVINSNTNIDQKSEIKQRVTRSSRKTPESPLKMKKVKILSQETIKEPITIKSKLIPVSSKHVLNPHKVKNPKKICYSQPTSSAPLYVIENTNQIEVPAKITPIHENQNENVLTVSHAHASLTPVYAKHIEQDKCNDFIEIELPACKENDKTENIIKIQKEAIDTGNSKEKRILRSTDIATKRRFNMRLRDIVEETFNKLESSETPHDNTKNMVEVNENCAQRKTTLTKDVSSQLSRGPEDLAKNLMDFMDCRLKRMENMLLLRIDNNSKHIADLRNTVENKNIKEVKALIRQPRQDNTSYKRGLFDEISQFLSAEAKSMIYEELFLNEFKPETEEIAEALRKTRKRKVT